MTDLPLEILARAWAGQDSLCSISGSRFYGELMTSDGLMILANGTIPDRSWLVERRVGSTAVAGNRVCVGGPPPIHNALSACPVSVI